MKHSKSLNSQNKQEIRTGILFLVPALVLIIVIAFYPFASVIYMSFTDRTFAGARDPKFVGVDNYKRLLSLTIKPIPQKADNTYEQAYTVLPTKPIRYTPLKEFSFLSKRYVLGASDADFYLAMFNTIIFTICAVFFETLFGLTIALILNHKFKGRGFMRMAMLLPWAIPTAVSSRMWEWMFSSSRIGLFNTIGEKLGITNGQFPFLIDTSTQLWAIVAVDVWKTTPFMALLILAGLQLIPAALYEASNVDGANSIQRFIHVTLPLLRKTIAIALTFRILDSMRVFDLFQIVFGNKLYSISSFTYFELIQNKAMGYSAASSMLIFVVLFIIAIGYIKLSGGVKNEH